MGTDEDKTDPKARPLPAPEREATPKEPGAVTRAITRLEMAAERIADEAADIDASGAHEVEQVKTRHETWRLVGDRLSSPTVMYPLLAFMFLSLLVLVAWATGTFDPELFIDAADKVPLP